MEQNYQQQAIAVNAWLGKLIESVEVFKNNTQR